MTSSDFLDSGSQIPSYRADRLRPRISLTSDVLDFRKCERKYGMYKIRKFQASAPTAEFVGTFAHRSLEMAWREAREGNSPNQDRMIEIMEGIRMQMINEEKRDYNQWNAVLKARLETNFQGFRHAAKTAHDLMNDGFLPEVSPRTESQEKEIAHDLSCTRSLRRLDPWGGRRRRLQCPRSKPLDDGWGI